MAHTPSTREDAVAEDWKPLLAKARQLHRCGDLTRSEAICRRILTHSPGQTDALHLAGLIAHADGRRDDAVGMLQQALETNPFEMNIFKNLILILREMDRMAAAASICMQALQVDSDNHLIFHGLGDLFYRDGNLEVARACYEKVLKLNPDLGSAWSNLGNALQDLDRPDEAVNCYRQALRSAPNNAEIYYNLGVAFSRTQLPEKAIECFEKALDLKPDHSQALFNMGHAYKSAGQRVMAIDCYRQCIQLNADDVDAWYNLANALYAQGQIQAAIDAYADTIRKKPDHVLAINNLGCLFKELGADGQAVSMFHRSIEIDPDFAPAYVNLGNACKERHDFEPALLAYQKALALSPDEEDALVSMGSLLKKEGRFEQGLNYLKRAVELTPEASPAWWYYYLALPILYETETEIEFYRRRFADGLDALIDAVKLETAEQCRKALVGIGSITNFYLQYQGLNDIELQKKYGRFVNRVMAANFPAWVTARSMPALKNGGRIRVGYLSSFMRAHTVGHFLMGWVANHDRANFEIYAYHIGRSRDALTAAFEQKCDRFRHLPGNIEAVARQILDDELHILVFTDIGMYAPATQLAGLRLAPVQCKGWGHPVTTGLSTIDYYLSSDLMEVKEADRHYCETLVRLPNLALALKAPQMPEKAKSRRDFNIPIDAFVFLTSQSLFKYLPQYDEIYPRIASAVKDAKFVFIANPSTGVTERFQKRIQAAFNRHDLKMDQFCIFQPRLSPDDFLSLNLCSNVLLDPFSWSGGKTTLEGISAGLPVVTCPGRYMRGRHAYAMLKMMGITDTVAADMDAYIAIACRLGNDRAFFERNRRAVISNRHRLFDDATCIRGLESFYCQIVKNQIAKGEAIERG